MPGHMRLLIQAQITSTSSFSYCATVKEGDIITLVNSMYLELEELKKAGEFR